MPWQHDGLAWASYQIRNIAGCACTGNAGNVSPHRRFQRKQLVNDPGIPHGTCVTHVPWCISGSLTRDGGENVPDIPGACARAILGIWQEPHGEHRRICSFFMSKWVMLVFKGTYCSVDVNPTLIYVYSIHVPGWLQKWLNLITAPGSVSNEPGSVTWLATKYLKTVSWRNHTEKLTTWWPQNIPFWP